MRPARSFAGTAAGRRLSRRARDNSRAAGGGTPRDAGRRRRSRRRAENGGDTGQEASRDAPHSRFASNGPAARRGPNARDRPFGATGAFLAASTPSSATSRRRRRRRKPVLHAHWISDRVRAAGWSRRHNNGRRFRHAQTDRAAPFASWTVAGEGDDPAAVARALIAKSPFEHDGPRPARFRVSARGARGGPRRSTRPLPRQRHGSPIARSVSGDRARPSGLRAVRAELDAIARASARRGGRTASESSKRACAWWRAARRDLAALLERNRRMELRLQRGECAAEDAGSTRRRPGRTRYGSAIRATERSRASARSARAGTRGHIESRGSRREDAHEIGRLRHFSAIGAARRDQKRRWRVLPSICAFLLGISA